jgi:azurin
LHFKPYSGAGPRGRAPRAARGNLLSAHAGRISGALIPPGAADGTLFEFACRHARIMFFRSPMKTRFFPALILALASLGLAAQAAPRVIEITANDQMKFSVATIDAKVGEELQVVLSNVGTLPKEAMGHNWVLLKPGTDVTAFATAAVTARDTDYVPAAMKDKVAAWIKVLGPKQKADTTFKLTAAGDYTFICSFPGHFMLMKGVIKVK